MGQRCLKKKNLYSEDVSFCGRMTLQYENKPERRSQIGGNIQEGEDVFCGCAFCRVKD